MTAARGDRATPLWIGLLALLSLTGALVTYKASAALGVASGVARTHALSARPEWIATAPLDAVLRPLAGAANYLQTVWIALVFGVLIGAVARAFIAPVLIRRALAGGPRGQLVAALAGAPLMLCSCCVAPVFDGVYACSGRLAPALSLQLAAPSLNPFALTLTFMLFPAPVSLARLFAAPLLVIGGGWLAARLGGMPRAPEERPQVGFGAALAEVAWRSLPGVLLGVLASAVLVQLVPLSQLGTGSRWLVIVAVVAAATPIALPTFAELPIGLGLLGAGAPPGAVVALLVAGPAINLASLLSMRRSVSGRAALATAGVVAMTALLAGLVVELVTP